MALIFRIEKQRCETSTRCPYQSGVRWDKFTARCFGDCLKRKVDDNWIDKALPESSSR